MDICPITKGKCGGSDCALWVTLDDFAGCPFELADRAIQDLKKNTLLPAALKLDGLVAKYLRGGGKDHL